MSDSLRPYGLYVARQALLSMKFPKQEDWSGLPCLPPGDLPNPGMESEFLTLSALTGGFFATSATWEGLSFLGSMIFHYLDFLFV